MRGDYQHKALVFTCNLAFSAMPAKMCASDFTGDIEFKMEECVQILFYFFLFFYFFKTFRIKIFFILNRTLSPPPVHKVASKANVITL